MSLKSFARNIINLKLTFGYKRYYKYLLKKNNINNTPCYNEHEWIKKWATLGRPNPIYYRLFSHYTGHNVNIIPENISRNIIEPILNPLQYTAYYSDKNIFDKLFPKGTMPQTIFRKIGGFYYDSEYTRLKLEDDELLYKILSESNCSKIVIKPAVDSSSGKGVRLFEYKNNRWLELGTSNELNIHYLTINYSDNLIVQECLEQAEFMSYYNPTSVNTLRLTLYRSVIDDECYIPSAIIRIGKNGALVDNAHAGGGYVGIKLDGTLCNKVLNQYGETLHQFNNIDFSKEHKIPNWGEILEFAKSVGRNIPHHRLLALDIMIDKAGTPRLIEFNNKAYSMWLFQFTTGPALGEFTDEIIKHCIKYKKLAIKYIQL